jgi:hypothetical protein
MQPIDFPEKTHAIAKDQDQYLTLPAHVDNSPERVVTSCWQLNAKELNEILHTGKIWIQQYSFGYPVQPILPSVVKPELKT